jgi:hypothetical protein
MPWFITEGWPFPVVYLLFEAYVAIYRPAWFGRFLHAFGSPGYADPFWPYSRWRWTTPPAGWTDMVKRTLFFGLLVIPILVAGLHYLDSGRPARGMIAFLLLNGLRIALPGIRMLAKVYLRV